MPTYLFHHREGHIRSMLSHRKLCIGCMILVLFLLASEGCENRKKESGSQQFFAVGQNVMFEKAVLIARTKADYIELGKALETGPVDLFVTLERAFYVEAGSRGTVLDQDEDTVRVRITSGSKNGYLGRTAKRNVIKTFPILPP